MKTAIATTLFTEVYGGVIDTINTSSTTELHLTIRKKIIEKFVMFYNYTFKTKLYLFKYMFCIFPMLCSTSRYSQLYSDILYEYIYLYN